MISQTNALLMPPGSRNTSARITSTLKNHDGVDRTAGAADHRQRTRGEHEFVATRCRQVVQQQTFQQRDAVVTDQSLMHREHSALRKRDDLDSKVVGAEHRDLAFGQPQCRLQVEARLAVKGDVVRAALALRPASAKQHDIAFEGLFVMNHTRGTQLAAELGRAYCVLNLTTPLGVCYQGITQRRAEKGKEKRNAKHTEDNQKRAREYAKKMLDAGALVRPASRESVVFQLLELLEQDG